MNQNIFKKFFLFLTMIIIVFSLFSLVYASENGHIDSLTTDKSSYPTKGETITITCVVHCTKNSGIANSHIDYRIIDLTTGLEVPGTRYRSSPGSLNYDQQYTDVWTITNTDFPSIGNYQIEATWRQGNGRWGSGDPIDGPVYTSIYSVPSPWLIVAFAGFLMAIAALTRKKRWWLSFYLTGAVALVSLIISFFIITGYDYNLMAIEAQNIAYLSTILGIPANFLPPNGFIFPDTTGWSIFGIGFECSSIIEISVLAGLLLLYPGYSYKRKMKYAAIGIVATYIANLVRMLSIIFIVNVFGKSTLYFAHAFIGKIIFFTFVILLYWYLLTRPTLDIVRSNIKSGKFEF